MKISIITVCYNSEATIERTLKSVLGQDYDNIEYIVVDGVSKDNTLKILSEYAPKFEGRGIEFKVISEPDKGMYDAMNKGVALASGDIIGILNSDDWYEDDALSAVAEATGTKKADIYMGAINIHNGNQLIVKHARNRKYKTSRDFNHPAMFVTKACYADVGGYEIGNVHDDYGWYLKAAKMGKDTVIIDRIITNYPTGGIGSKKSFKNTCNRIGTKYEIYKRNGYSRLYFLECVAQELAKYILLKG